MLILMETLEHEIERRLLRRDMEKRYSKESLVARRIGSSARQATSGCPHALALPSPCAAFARALCAVASL
jgi:hypothetical protein